MRDGPTLEEEEEMKGFCSSGIVDSFLGKEVTLCHFSVARRVSIENDILSFEEQTFIAILF